VAGLRELWNDVVPDAGTLADDLVGRYAGKDRHAYRDRYVVTVLIAMASLDQLCTDPTAVRLAAWFHRAVHAPGSTAGANAEASAQLAEEVLPGYGVSHARTAEVARLVRLTGGAESPKAQDPNADVLLDAVNAILADNGYPIHAADVRRDAEDESFAETARRYAEIRGLLNSHIYRTQLARDRFESAARANLTAELAILEAQLPAPWRGWQRAALVVTAGLTALVAFVAAFAATRVPWRVPAYGEDSAWPPVILTILALAAVPALSWYSRRPARIVARAAIVVGVVGVVAVWVTAPAANEASGVGRRVPLLVISSLLLIVAGAASLGASALSGNPGQARNRGQVLAGLGAAAVIVLATIFVIDPLQRAYLLNANELLEGQHLPAAQNATELTGVVAWTMRPGEAGGSVRELVATRFGIAASRQAGTIEMLDAATGKVRWRYTRSDSTERPRLYALSGGQSLLADFDDLGYFVLDADTGRRKAAWPGRTKDYAIDTTDPLVTGLSVSKGSDKLYGTNVDGSNRWTYEPGRCTSISAAATADTVIAHLGHSCGTESDELVGLNLSNGKRLWSHSGTSLNGLTAVGGTVVAVELENGETVQGRGTLVGLEPRSGEVKWRWTMPTQWSCPPQLETADNLVVLISCPSPAEVMSHTVATAIDAGTGRVAWTATTAIPHGERYAVTRDGRVVFAIQEPGACRLTSVGENKTALLPVRCDRGVVAAGDVILVAGDHSLTALG
jgi:predicted metal-dependent HD superfamily phosphohydrolase/outer membrane protein assembly factor BamB